jgi:DNA transformation protein
MRVGPGLGQTCKEPAPGGADLAYDAPVRARQATLRRKRQSERDTRVTSGDGGAGRRSDRTFVAYVLDQLGGLPGVESRAMFGGHGLYCGGEFFAIIFRGRLYFRTSPATRPAYQASGMSAFRPSARQTLNSYYEVPAEVLEDAAEVARWARAAVAAGAKPRSRERA